MGSLMHPAVRKVVDRRRRCGWRTVPGALYLMAPGNLEVCGKFPIPFAPCPHCGEEEGFSRQPYIIREGMRWLWNDKPCTRPGGCRPECRLSGEGPQEPMLLMWIGTGFYRTPDEFLDEAARQGISRRIGPVPRGLVRDPETGQYPWLMLAHAKAIYVPPEEPSGRPTYRPGIIGMVRPTEIQVLVGNDTPHAQVEAWLKKGYSPVQVTRAGIEPAVELAPVEQPELL
jgi:hypothetical protein